MGGPLGKTTIGRLRHRVLIQSPAAPRERDASGAEVAEWSDGETVWCEVRAASGRELFASGHVQAQVSHLVRMRHRTGLTEQDRMVWLDGGDAVLNIIAILPSVGVSNMLDVWCIQEK
jgi:SPP1 family predicted phage head-tail adaptor